MSTWKRRRFAAKFSTFMFRSGLDLQVPVTMYDVGVKSSSEYTVWISKRDEDEK